MTSLHRRYQKLSSKQKTILLFSFIASVVFIAFLPSLFCDFTNWDDDWLLTNNPIIRKFTLENIFKNIFGSFYSKYIYLPTVFLSYAIEYHFFGLNPFIYHLDNIILHIFNTILVFIFINLLSGNKKAALVACLFWSINPLRVESVTWITERKDVLYGFFYLLSLIKYVHYLKSGEKKIHLILSLLFFIFSCLSKLTAVSLGLIIILLDYYYQRRFDFRAIAEKTIFFLISLGYGLLTIWTVRASESNFSTYVFSGFERSQIASHNFINYILKAFIPYNLSAWHPYQYLPGNLPKYYLLFFLLSLIIVVAALWIFVKYRNRKLIFGLLFFAFTVIFALMIFPAGDAVFCDRHIYISCIGFSFLIGELYLFLIKKFPEKIIASLTGLILIIYGIYTHQQTKVWKNGISLFSQIIERYPDDFIGYINRGSSKFNDKNFTGALSDYKIGLQKKPAFYFNEPVLMTMVNIGTCMKELKDLNGALNQLNSTIKISPAFPAAYYSRGEVFFEMNKFPDAKNDFSKAIELDTNNFFQKALAFTQRGRTKIVLKEYDSAIDDLKSSIDIFPDYSDALYLEGLCYYSKKEFNHAKSDFLKTLEINPKHEIACFYMGLNEIAAGNMNDGCDFLQKAALLSSSEAKKMLFFYCGDPETKKKMFFLNGKMKFQLIKGVDSKKDSVYHLCNFDSLGNLLQQGVFDSDKGKYNGEIRWYYPDGSLKKIGFSRNDTTYGQWKEFYHDSTLRAEYFYANGEMDSIYRHYYPNSNLWIERIYQKGRLIKINACNDINGKPLKPGSFSNGNGSLNIFDESGKVIMVQQYKNGLRVQ